MDPGDLEALEVHERKSHAEPVDCDHPGPRSTGVTEDDGRGGLVGPEGHPPIAAGLVRVGFETAVPTQPVVAEARRPAPPAPYVTIGKCWRPPMVRARVLDPAAPGVQVVGVGELGRHPRVVPGER